MPQILVVLGIIIFDLAVMLLRFKMNWLGIGPTFLNLMVLVILALIVSKTVIKRKLDLRASLSFRGMVITISLLLGSMTSNVLLQLTQRQLFGHFYTGDSSKVAYEEQHGRTDELLGTRLTPDQANSLSQTKRVAHELMDVTSEEIIFRWIVLGALLLTFSRPQAVFISSMFFAAIHLVFPIALGNLEWGLMRLLPTFAIGVYSGIAFIWYGLPASVFVHFVGNLVRVFAYDEYDFIVDWILWGSVFVTFVVLPPTLWLTRKNAAKPKSCLEPGLFLCR
ncbi:MAG TPA: CPBP family intramembrane glutamic endopeptidase [Oligoflexus sp.]|uniref:CPBP family intramembrane glutamic endopeptidase n=1 Tax=Oligoflexus sp. TaxID=1971216 RepID=UPI002D80C865|nr:CPBP family intramembrane glutamic endopeptidase [Oligoflexus sp.]HET9241392.1 CPBP family intramembrane glutamic endopeptidase [Oligoflexus sp.]